MALDLGHQPSEEQLWVGYGQPNPGLPESYPAAAEDPPQLLPDQPSYCEVNPPPVLSSPLQPSIYDLEISIHYRKREMLKMTLSTALLQLHYQQEAPEFNAHQLCFPSTDGLLDHKQIEFTNRILNSIQRGLFLQVQTTGIYAWRQDRCHVFASTSDPSVAHPDPTKLPQNTMVQLLSFEKYVNELKQFKENNGSSPDYTINMCFGEKFPDGKPLEKKLIIVKVVPLICRHFHEVAQMEGASSLHSANVSLQISHNSLYDLISSVFGLPADEDPARAAAPFLPQISRGGTERTNSSPRGGVTDSSKTALSSVRSDFTKSRLSSITSTLKSSSESEGCRGSCFTGTVDPTVSGCSPEAIDS
ncbi:hypothetical protein FQN60_014408, partial [Etheostoma spectabile]